MFKIGSKIFSLRWHFKRICSSEKVFERRLGDLKSFLVERGYDHDFIDTKFLRVRNHHRADLLNSKNKLGNKDNLVTESVVLLIIIRL